MYFSRCVLFACARLSGVLRRARSSLPAVLSVLLVLPGAAPAQEDEWETVQASDMIVQISETQLSKFRGTFRRRQRGFQEYEEDYRLQSKFGPAPFVIMYAYGLSPAGETWLTDAIPPLAEFAPEVFSRFEVFAGPLRTLKSRQGPIDVRPFKFDNGLLCTFFMKWAADFEFDLVPSAEASAGLGKALAYGAYCAKSDLTSAATAAEVDAFVLALSMPKY